jgi:hypothetical protein
MRKTTPEKKLVLYIENFLESDYFQNKVLEIRKKYNIPLEGYSFKFDGSLNDDDLNSYKYKCLFDYPEEIKRPNQLMYTDPVQFLNDINKILIKTEWHIPVSYNNFPLLSILKDRVIYGKNVKNEFEQFFLKELEEEFKETGLLKTSNYLDNWPDLCNLVLEKNHKERSLIVDHLLEEMLQYPVFIKISPYASRRDVEDYIAKNWKKISENQEIFKNQDTKIGKQRKRKEKVNNLHKSIWNYYNMGLGLEEIRKNINANIISYKDIIGYEDITKILSLERKRRKQV